MPPPVIADSALDDLATPLLRLDADGVVRDANAALAAWLGVGRRRLAGRHAAALLHYGDGAPDAGYLRDGHGKDVVPQQVIELSRDYVAPATDSRGKASERELLAKELRRDMAAAILRRIDASSRLR